MKGSLIFFFKYFFFISWRKNTRVEKIFWIVKVTEASWCFFASKQVCSFILPFSYLYFTTETDKWINLILLKDK